MLAIGDELLDGRVVDSNTQTLAELLEPLGACIAQRTTVADKEADIVREAHAAIERGADCCVISGGLGPTRDDRTRAALAELAGVALTSDADQAERIRQRLARRGRPLTDNQLRQAELPAGATVVPNPKGTACGFELVVRSCRFIAVPGVPGEFATMVEQALVAPLRGSAVTPRPRQILTCFGLVEAEVDARLAELAERWPAVDVGYRATFPEIHVTVSSKQPDAAQAVSQAAQRARELLGMHAYGDASRSFAETVVDALRSHAVTLSTAESCTGGLVGDMLTDVAGASDVYMAGVVAYSNAAKQALLGVQQATLASHGAVSEPTVVEMARGARERFGTHYAVAISGIAGPGGGTPEKPVGTVWLACAGADETHTACLALPFARRGVKVVSAYSALDLVRRRVLNAPQDLPGAVSR